MRTCHRHYPGRFNGACSLVPLHRQRSSRCNSQVGSCNCFFEACSAFTRVTACTLAESPSDPLHRKLRQLRCLRCRFDCYRVERTSSRAGVSPAEVQRLSRRTFTSTTVGQTCCFIAVGIVSCLLAIRTTCTRNTVEKEGAGEAPERAARRAAKGSSQRGPELIPPLQKGQFPGAGASIRPG